MILTGVQKASLINIHTGLHAVSNKCFTWTDPCKSPWTVFEVESGNRCIFVIMDCQKQRIQTRPFAIICSAHPVCTFSEILGTLLKIWPFSVQNQPKLCWKDVWNIMQPLSCQTIEKYEYNIQKSTSAERRYEMIFMCSSHYTPNHRND